MGTYMIIDSFSSNDNISDEFIWVFEDEEVAVIENVHLHTLYFGV